MTTSQNNDMFLLLGGAIFFLSLSWVINNWDAVKYYLIHNVLINLSLSLLIIIGIAIFGWLVFYGFVLYERRQDNKIREEQEKILLSKIKERENLINKIKSELAGIALEGRTFIEGEYTKERRSLLQKVVDKLDDEKYFEYIDLFDFLVELKSPFLDEISKIDKHFSEEEISRREKIALIREKLSKGFFRASELTPEEKSLALEDGFKEVKIYGLNPNDGREFIIYPRGNCGDEHFVLNHLIAEYIKENYDENVRITYAQDSDVIFSVDGEEWGIEIETGKVIRDKNQFENKIELLNKRYGNKWMIVVTNGKITWKYKKYTERVYNRQNICNEISKLFKSEVNLGT